MSDELRMHGSLPPATNKIFTDGMSDELRIHGSLPPLTHMPLNCDT